MRSELLVGSGGAGNGKRNSFIGIGETEGRRRDKSGRRGKVSDWPFEKADVCTVEGILDVDVRCVNFLPTTELVFGVTDVGVEKCKEC